MIAICTPTKEFFCSGTTYDIVEIIRKTPDSYLIVSQGSILPQQRTSLVRQAISSHVSHILFVDSDMRLPNNTIERLLSHKKDIVGANCKHRQANKWTADISSKNKTGIQEVNKIGFGVTLIRTEVFFKIAEPWFAMPYNGKEFVGDDVFFCHKARESGFKIFIDHDLSRDVKHIGSVEL